MRERDIVQCPVPLRGKVVEFAAPELCTGGLGDGGSVVCAVAAERLHVVRLLYRCERRRQVALLIERENQHGDAATLTRDFRHIFIMNGFRRVIT